MGKTNLFSLEPQLLAKAVTKLQFFYMADNQLTRDHVKAIFTSINRETKLIRLSIQVNYLSSVDPEVLAEVVNKMTYVNIARTCLSLHQVTQILL